jgi:hypothetical protein
MENKNIEIRWKRIWILFGGEIKVERIRPSDLDQIEYNVNV